jgi:hypothetical protein
MVRVPKPASSIVLMRLTRRGAVPLSHELDEAYEFGLQDTKQNIVPGVSGPDGLLIFDFELTVKPSPDPDHPVFTGLYASGPVNDRFVYLSWHSIERGVYINRLKASLRTITWPLVHNAQSSGRRIAADTTDWRLGDPHRIVGWHLAPS